MTTSVVRSGSPIVVDAHGLVLREWDADDVPRMVALFNTREMDRWTPLPHPFSSDVAAAYARRAHRARVVGLLRLAITENRVDVLGEVLLFPR